MKSQSTTNSSSPQILLRPPREIWLELTESDDEKSPTTTTSPKFDLMMNKKRKEDIDLSPAITEAIQQWCHRFDGLESVLTSSTSSSSSIQRRRSLAPEDVYAPLPSWLQTLYQRHNTSSSGSLSNSPLLASSSSSSSPSSMMSNVSIFAQRNPLVYEEATKFAKDILRIASWMKAEIEDAEVFEMMKVQQQQQQQEDENGDGEKHEEHEEEENQEEQEEKEEEQQQSPTNNNNEEEKEKEKISSSPKISTTATTTTIKKKTPEQEALELLQHSTSLFMLGIYIHSIPLLEPKTGSPEYWSRQALCHLAHAARIEAAIVFPVGLLRRVVASSFSSSSSASSLDNDFSSSASSASQHFIQNLIKKNFDAPAKILSLRIGPWLGNIWGPLLLRNPSSSSSASTSPFFSSESSSSRIVLDPTSLCRVLAECRRSVEATLALFPVPIEAPSSRLMASFDDRRKTVAGVSASITRRSRHVRFSSGNEEISTTHTKSFRLAGRPRSPPPEQGLVVPPSSSSSLAQKTENEDEDETEIKKMTEIEGAKVPISNKALRPQGLFDDIPIIIEEEEDEDDKIAAEKSKKQKQQQQQQQEQQEQQQKETNLQEELNLLMDPEQSTSIKNLPSRGVQMLQRLKDLLTTSRSDSVAAPLTLKYLLPAQAYNIITAAVRRGVNLASFAQVRSVGAKLFRDSGILLSSLTLLRFVDALQRLEKQRRNGLADVLAALDVAVGRGVTESIQAVENELMSMSSPSSTSTKTTTTTTNENIVNTTTATSRRRRHYEITSLSSLIVAAAEIAFDVYNLQHEELNLATSLLSQQQQIQQQQQQTFTPSAVVVALQHAAFRVHSSSLLEQQEKKQQEEDKDLVDETTSGESESRYSQKRLTTISPSEEAKKIRQELARKQQKRNFRTPLPRCCSSAYNSNFHVRNSVCSTSCLKDVDIPSFEKFKQNSERVQIELPQFPPHGMFDEPRVLKSKERQKELDFQYLQNRDQLFIDALLSSSSDSDHQIQDDEQQQQQQRKNLQQQMKQQRQRQRVPSCAFEQVAPGLELEPQVGGFHKGSKLSRNSVAEQFDVMPVELIAMRRQLKSAKNTMELADATPNLIPRGNAFSAAKVLTSGSETLIGVKALKILGEEDISLKLSSPENIVELRSVHYVGKKYSSAEQLLSEPSKRSSLYAVSLLDENHRARRRMLKKVRRENLLSCDAFDFE